MRRAALSLALVLLATVPAWVGGSYYVNIVSQVLISAIFALSLNVIVGYAGLISLGQAGLFGVAAYGAAILLGAGAGHSVAVLGALVLTVAASALFAVLSLRTTGIGFIMITLALGQILWGLAYRWISLTNGDNGITGAARPAPFGLSLASAPSFYYATLLVFLATLAAMSIFARSAFGAALRGTRDQPRRMSALGYDVWLIRWITFVYAGFWGAVSGLLFVYYHKYIHPVSLSLANSAEGLLAVIAGGSGTLAGPLVGAAIVMLLKNYVSAYIERWNMLLGFVFVLIVVFMPEGVVPGVKRLWRRFASKS